MLNVVAASKALLRWSLRDPEGFLGSNTMFEIQHTNINFLRKVGHLICDIIQADVLC